MADMKARVRFLRKNQTPAEAKLWSILRAKRFHGFKFRRQHEISFYIADFVCLKCRLIIEADGHYHGLHAQKEYDDERRKILEAGGFKILRFTNDEILNDIEKVKAVIYAKLVLISTGVAPFAPAPDVCCSLSPGSSPDVYFSLSPGSSPDVYFSLCPGSSPDVYFSLSPDPSPRIGRGEKTGEYS